MNRTERRQLGRKGVKVPKEPVINVKKNDIDALKEKAANDAADKAFILMLAIPVMVIHDKYSLLMKREVDGKSREERFTDLCLDLYDTFEKGYVTIDELADVLKEECGLKIERSRKR